MSLLRKILSSVGFGAAKVETVVTGSVVHPGQELSGVVLIHGGEVEQPVGAMHLELCTNYIYEHETRRRERIYVLTETGIYQPFVLGRKEEREFPFSLPIPLDCPISRQLSKVWLATRLDISMAIDPKDHEPIEVAPLPDMAMTVEALELLGMRCTKVGCESVESLNRDRPFSQLFTFSPASGPFRGRFDELELVFHPDTRHLGVQLLLDRSTLTAIAAKEVSLTLAAAELREGSHGLANLLQARLSEACA